ncbi:MAG: decarboxylating NADP(+)-dependent phosphogluconate dehydrogenase [Proteobacteria bacterium]|nr:decarboxylating NADP(+)-dependent phosphogluconate dehydrogenase [Pseudomonadota bacterium]
MAATADIGLIGLAVMGQNLVMNMSDHGFTVAVYNRTTAKVDEFLEGTAKGSTVIGTHSVQELCASLQRPRRVMLLIQAGKAVDAVINELAEHLEPGDIIIDGGNSHYTDSIRRCKMLEEKGLLFVGCGVSGGEEGARRGPSLMPGGSAAAWPALKPIFQAIAAKAPDGTPCADWVGDSGSGHFVKMVHNGIEYGDMQLISESYDILRNAVGMSLDDIADVFTKWNEGALDSYLVSITGSVLRYKDEDGQPLVDKILDLAMQKGTGKWTSQASLDMDVPLTLITEAVLARFLSALKDERVHASTVLGGPRPEAAPLAGERNAVIDDLGKALFAAKIASYTQGYMLFRAAARIYGWNLNYGGIALLWREGCIIRSAFLGRIKEAYDRTPDLVNLMLDPYFKAQVEEGEGPWRRIVARAVTAGVPVPALSSALAFYDGYRRGRLPANIVQALRDYFGAHTYERVDRPRGEFFHTNWTGQGGAVTAGTYGV